jgi:hypothetical protein
MQNITPSWLLLAPFGLVLLTWAACRWWYGRRHHRLEHRFGKLHADRDALQEQVKRAREQVAQLQKELATWRLAGPAKSATGRPAETHAAPQAPVQSKAEILGGLVFEAPQLAAHGFADTQPFADDSVSDFAPKGA